MTNELVATPTSAGGYEPLPIERRWQGAWREADAFATPSPVHDQPDTYIFVAPPFTSGDIHIGHVRSYTLADAHARFRRARGDAVLFALGFDAFGLPAELGAIAHGESPVDWVDRCRGQMQDQFEQLGYSFDWSRTFSTCEPDMYRWSQWLFLALLEDGLIYRREGQVDWCETCHTVLATTQVSEGRCWRCNGTVQLVYRAQWYLRLSAYNEENDRRVNDLAGWNKIAVTSQRAILGRVEGVELEAYTLDGTALTVFTPYPDAIAEAEFVALSPNHPELSRWIDDSDLNHNLESMGLKVRRNHDAHAEDAELAILETGLSLQIPEGARPLPVVISPYVDARFGSTAILGIPTRDATDKLIATALKRSAGLAWRLHERQTTRPAMRYRAADFPISRQRAWGTPIPIIYCDGCGTTPVPVDQLPVTLPPNLVVREDHNALAGCQDFVSCICPECGHAARRETDTLDCHMDITWIELPLAVPRADRARAMFTHPELSRWLPVGQFIHGADTGGFVLTERMMAKFLRDRGTLDFLSSGEPYGPTFMHEMVKLVGRKMSKHLGNVVNPKELVERFGADTVRFAILYAAAPSRSFNWNDHILDYCHKFLTGLWEFADPRLDATSNSGPEASIESSDQLRLRLATWCQTAIEKITENFETLEMQRATRNVILLLDRIEDFERRAMSDRGALDERDRAAVSVALRLLLQLLAPISPHIAEELWQHAGCSGTLITTPWPAPMSIVNEVGSE